MTEGYKALTQAAAVVDLSARTRIRATGEDRARLLHALTTNHVQQLLPGHGCYAFFLNAQGRILADANLLVFAEHILIDAEPEVRRTLYAHLDHYIIADDVALEDETETTFCLGVEGPEADAVLTHLRAPVPESDFAHENWNDLAVARVSWTGEPGFRIFGPLERKAAVMDLLYLTPASSEDAEVVRIEHAKPRHGVDILAATLPAETGLVHAIHAKKGCYLGQEIVERVRSRGHVNKRLVAIEFAGTEPLEAGTKLTAGGKEVGEITSSALSPSRGAIVALAYARVPNDVSGSVVEVEGKAGRVVKAVERDLPMAQE